jgi:hypothetical protein
LPLVGKCSHGEAITLTLTFFWPVLLMIHWLVHLHQSIASRTSILTRFPGMLRDLEIPTAFGGLRILLFGLLLVWPSFAHVVLTIRSFTHMSIVFDYDGEAYLLPDDSRRESKEQAERDVLRYRGLAQLSWLCPPRNGQGNVSGEWRWLHWRDEDQHVVQRPADAKKPAGWALQPQHWPTAVPVIQPWGFLIVAIGLTLSTCVMLLRPVLRR